MLTDLRFIIGIFFVFCGITLLAAGIFGTSDLVEGVHMNTTSGAMMLAFGILMVSMAAFQKKE